jgi:hypothetical protein
MGLEIQVLNASTSREIDTALSGLARQRPDALFVGQAPFLASRRVQFILQAAYHRVPACYPGREYAEVGGLMSYGSDVADAFLIFIDAGEERHALASLSTVFSDKIPADFVLHYDRRERCDRSSAQSPYQARCFSLDRVSKPCPRLRQLSARRFTNKPSLKECDAEGTDAVGIMSRVRVTMLRVRELVLTDSPRTPGNIIRLIPSTTGEVGQ